MKRIYALIPSYQPDEKLIRLTEELSEYEEIWILVVDDGSGQDYQSVFRSLPEQVNVLSYPDNHGKGYALKTGLQWIYENETDLDAVVVTVDGDGQHAVADILKTAQAAAGHPDHLVLGVRSFGEGTPLRSRFGNKVTSMAFYLTSGVHLSDTQTGLRAFSVRQIPQMLAIPGDRYEYEMNVLQEAAHRHEPLDQIPIQTIYENHNSGSHFRTVRDSLRIYGCLFRFALVSLLSFLLDYLLFTAFSMSGLLSAGANVLARCFSSVFNYSMNRKVVFDNKGSPVTSAVQYFTLAAVILFLNTRLLVFLNGTLGWNLYLAKLVVEMVFFCLSYIVQKRFIFTDHPAAEKAPAERVRIQ